MTSTLLTSSRSSSTSTTSVPLRIWIQDETARGGRLGGGGGQEQQHANENHYENDAIVTLLQKQSLLRKITVALGTAELIQHASRITMKKRGSNNNMYHDLAKQCNVDNFIVEVKNTIHHHHSSSFSSSSSSATTADIAQWNNVMGVIMLFPRLFARLLDPLFLIDSKDACAQNILLGRCVDFILYPPLPRKSSISENSSCETESNGEEDAGNVQEDEFDERNECRLFGMLLYEICTGTPCPSCPSLLTAPSPYSGRSKMSNDYEPPRKRPSIVQSDKKGTSSQSFPSSSLHSWKYTLQASGCPSSIVTLFHCLVDDNNTYCMLGDVCNDTQLLLSDPDCFLFDREIPVSQQGVSESRNIHPQFKIGKLYGRDDEVTQITDAFCRVSSGMNEALFIGGYSGSGKSMLVQSLRARIDIAGGYVLTQKFDEVSQERPLLNILRAFDKLCLLILEKSSPQTLMEIIGKLKTVFESDFSVLARLLPNIKALLPEEYCVKPAEDSKSGMNLHGLNINNISYTLQRFLKIVSSTETPIMLFLDDLQWAGSTSLELIDALFSDKRGCTCFLFVGCYRDNEVQEGCSLLRLMSGLDSSGVNVTKIRLKGLHRDSLNMMISESLGTLPTLCRPLSNIILEKTAGNPYFAIEFLISLVNRSLLMFSNHERRWIWDEIKIRSENVPENVLNILIHKMSSLAEDVQSILKVVSCFGNEVQQNIVDYLSMVPHFSRIADQLIHVVDQSYIVKTDSGFQFIHDKVREAAYSLIPANEKSQFHFNLGMLLHTVSNSKGSSDVSFPIADQINHGVPSLVRSEVCLEIVDLNIRAGVMATELSDHETAFSYFSKALSLLPISHWEDHYELSLRLYCLSAKASYYCDHNIQRTQSMLDTIVMKGRSIQDKFDALYLNTILLYDSGELDAACAACRKVLLDCGESIPDKLHSEDLSATVNEIGKLLKSVANDHFMEMKDMDTALRPTLRFLSLMLDIAYYKNPDITFYIGCKMIDLTLNNGVCEESVYSLVQYAALTCQRSRNLDDIQEACRIGKIAMKLMTRFSSPEFTPKVFAVYYGFIAVHSEPLHLCAYNLRRGFDVGISSGTTSFAFFNSISFVRNALFSGENLLSLSNEIDHHLEVMTRFKHTQFRVPLMLFRDTVSKIISKAQPEVPDINSSNERNGVLIYFNAVLQSFWLGHSERCDHYAKRVLGMKHLGSHNWLMILFYTTLNAFHIYNCTPGGRCRSKFLNLRKLYLDAIAQMRSFGKLSPTTYNGKVLLLEAEMHSTRRENEVAQSKYFEAFCAFGTARISHEQGLVCERAGFHFTRLGHRDTALHYFRLAKNFYDQWGSGVKVEFMTQQISQISSQTNA